MLSGTALWHHPGRLVPIRYVVVRDVAGELRPQAFLCTDLKADPVDILRWFVRRWWGRFGIRVYAVLDINTFGLNRTIPLLARDFPRN